MIKENNQIVLNAIQIDEYFIINGLGILQESKELEFIFDDNHQFFKFPSNYLGNNKLFIIKENSFIKLSSRYLIKIDSMIDLLNKLGKNFISKIVRFLIMKDDFYDFNSFNIVSYSSFILLEINKNDQIPLNSISNFIYHQQKAIIGDEIYCKNSGLSTLLYDYFSNSSSKGVC